MGILQPVFNVPTQSQMHTNHRSELDADLYCTTSALFIEPIRNFTAPIELAAAAIVREFYTSLHLRNKRSAKNITAKGSV